MRSFIQRLHTRFSAPGENTDERLLTDFVAHRADDAFAEIVRRHGPMVRGVCRRVLRNDADADDAFQAVFVVLLRKADAVCPRSRLGNFLYGVAVNVARRSRDSLARRRVQELVTDVPQRESGAAEQNDLRGVIDQELCELPAAYRAAVVACDLEGHSRSEAAGRLGWSEGTVASRLARGRAILADRLTRRGVALPAAGLLAALGSTTADALPVMSVSLLASSPPAVEALATEVTKAMTASKFKLVLLAVGLTIGLTGAGVATAWACGGLTPRPVEPGAAEPAPTPRIGASPKPETAKPTMNLVAAGEDKPGATDSGAAAKPTYVVLGNPAQDITVVSDRDEKFVAFFRRQPVMIAGVPANVRDKLLHDAKGSNGHVFVNYASFNAEDPRTAVYGASVKLAPLAFNGPVYRLLVAAPKEAAVVFVRDATDKDLWYAVGFTRRSSAGFFAIAERVKPDDFAPADLLHAEPKGKK